ncbi:AbrB/MazE/SpoVT family DNA-binding domain-containing protein [Luteipulveratus halotolerans]|uniref:SpoVT-AbrB domain-containing protein n=1 Tax=Luteipulveratus halotolerans TaxID=1631356 RepID=A0A0L6CJK1_9MICO|nr:AbrB/MazE/SpoVT family DNA-binding domain-containing protein [Luteipulveratus halotolerans]KNX37914.1 hypothetical protein VV01_13335 [Luteipulveratus halotolerans]
MHATVTISTKGQLTVPAAIRERLRIRDGDRLSVTVDEGGDSMRIERVPDLDELSTKFTALAAQVDPVRSVGDYMAEHWDPEA